jgi:hypothetical protein
MVDVIDGSIDDPKGRKKVFVRRRPDEDAEDFAVRALELMIRSGTAFICEHDPDEEMSRGR